MTQQIPYITAADIEAQLSWPMIVEALREGHRTRPAQIKDMLLRVEGRSLLNRAAWVDGLGWALKSVTVFPQNAEKQPPLPTVQGAMLLFDEKTGAVKAVIDGALVTRWKTCADSLLGASLLARPDSETVLMVGAGAVVSSLLPAYVELFPGLKRFLIWNRNPDRAEHVRDVLKEQQGLDLKVETDLASACAQADIISSATLAVEPVLFGDWIRSGTHVDLIGAYRPDMREADDTLLCKADLYVDSRDTLHEIGELGIPLAAGVISEDDICGDFYDLLQAADGRKPEAITLFKNGGGAHLDLMTGEAIYRCWLDSNT